MNRFISILLGILVFLISFMPYETMAQNTTKTAYQKRMEQIDKEMAQKFGYSEPNDIVALEILNGMAEYLKGQNTSRAKIYSWYINEQEKAKKLKTQADFDREKREQDALLAQKKEAEAKRAAEKENEKIRSTDYYIIRKNIKNDFEKWNQKGEFESTSAYEERLQNQSVSKFYDLCTDKLTDYYKHDYDITAKLQNYNADEQYYPITITFGTDGWREFKIERETYASKLYVSIKDAQEFKEDFYERSNKWEGEITDFVLDADDCLVLPKVTYVRYGFNPDAGYYVHDKYECIVPIKNGRKIEFAFKDLGIQNPYCQSAVWNVDMIRLAEEEKIRQEKEQRRQDSIACIEYNRQLDSLVTAYNQKLLQEEYNLDKKTIKFLPLEVGVRNGQEIEKWFNEEQNSITKKYNSIMDSSNKNRKIVDDYKRTNYDDLKSFVFKERVSSLPSGHNSYTYYNCPEYIYKGILVSRAYNKYSDELIAKLIEATVDINTQLNDEWTRNGQYFENKVDFFDSFLNYSTGSRTINKNPKYESILKDKIYYKMPEEERQRVDSINCVEYNHKLDSIVSTCNEKLRKEGYYNLKNEKIENVSLKCGKGIEDRFETEKDKVEKNFNTIMKEIDKNKKTIEDYKRINIDNIKSFSFAKFVDNTSDAYGRIITNQKPAYILDVREGDLLNEKLIEFIVDTNKQLNKEWSKDGQYFESKVEFYSIYLKFGYHQVGVNPEYKTILKEKKKTK